jgi:D-alanyl-D-alanine carboxypeptidase
MKLKWLIVASAMVLVGRPLEAQNFTSWVEDYLKQQVLPRGNFRGSVLVQKDGEVLFEKGFGLAVEGWGIPNSPDTIFEIASLTKQFTAAAILQLVESGKVELDDPVTKYYKDAPDSWARITIHQLLTHTSGIPNNDLKDFTKGICVPYSPEELIQTFRTRPLTFPPGTKWAYTDTEYYLLAYIIEKVSGEPFGIYLARHIFSPLEMKHSGFAATLAIVPGMAEGYSRNENGTLSHRDYFDRSLELGAGGIYTNIQDLQRWNRALDKPGILSSNSLKLMFTKHPPGSYGYGWFVENEPRLKVFHEGGDPGFSAYELRYPNEHLLIVVLANEDDAPVREVAETLAGYVLTH